MNHIDQDRYTKSIPEEARVVHTHLKLKVDFDRKVLKGKATLTIERKPFIDKIILDNYDLKIMEVTNHATGVPLRYDTGLNYFCGKPFTISLPRDQENNGKCIIQIKYETSPSSPALNWLTPEQTADGTQPFLMSNSQYIHAKAMFPCQDTPSVKFTYTAEISVRKNFTVIMSAVLSRTRETKHKRVYKFTQTIPIPSYAVVIAVGSLEKANLSPRSSVFAESKLSADSIRTFKKIECILQAAEDLCGTYFGGTYDICVLPPSIGHFEIECPCVAFISPILLGADMTLVSSLARNIAHNWAGILVTCAHYNDLWLHKSFSILIYRRILQRMNFSNEIKEFFRNNMYPEYERQIETVEIKDGSLQSKPPKFEKSMFSSPQWIVSIYTLYEMGCIVMEQLEKYIGGPMMLDRFLKSYFDKFAFKSIKTDDWKEHLYSFFPEKVKELEIFFTTKSYKPLVISVLTPIEIVCIELADKWENWNDTDINIPYKFILDVMKFSDLQKIIFLNCLHKSKLTAAKLDMMQSNLYDFHVRNYEIRFHWIRLCIKNRWKPIVNTALNFATNFGMPKYACSIFEDMYEWKEMGLITTKAYKRNEKKFFHETQKQIRSILHLN